VRAVAGRPGHGVPKQERVDPGQAGRALVGEPSRYQSHLAGAVSTRPRGHFAKIVDALDADLCIASRISVTV